MYGASYFGFKPLANYVGSNRTSPDWKVGDSLGARWPSQKGQTCLPRRIVDSTIASHEVGPAGPHFRQDAAGLKLRLDPEYLINGQ